MIANQIVLKRGEGQVKRLKEKTSPTGESKFFYVLFSFNGKKYKINTKTEVWKEAYDYMVERKAELAKGALPAKSQVIFRWENMRELLLANYRAKGRIVHVGTDGELYFRGRTQMDQFFKGMAVSCMDSEKIGQYVKTLETQGLSGPAIRRQLDCLGKAFSLAKQSGKIQNVPYIEKPKESAPAGKIITPGEFKRILAAMPEVNRPLFIFLNATACRIGAALQITWQMVSEDCTTIALPAAIVKNRESLTLPLKGKMLAPVAAMLRTMNRCAGVPVFFSEDYLEVWQRACVAAGVATYDKDRKPRYQGPRVHDNRVAGVRNLVRAGVPQDLVMKIAGMKTGHIFSRYNVCNLNDFEAALVKAGEYASTQAA